MYIRTYNRRVKNRLKILNRLWKKWKMSGPLRGDFLTRTVYGKTRARNKHIPVALGAEIVYCDHNDKHNLLVSWGASKLSQVLDNITNDHGGPQQDKNVISDEQSTDLCRTHKQCATVQTRPERWSLMKSNHINPLRSNHSQGWGYSQKNWKLKRKQIPLYGNTGSYLTRQLMELNNSF